MTPEAFVLSLLSGFSGVLVGAVITTWNDELKQKDLIEGSARVTFFEIAHCSAYLAGAIKAARTIGPIPTSTWRATQATIAQALKPDEVAVVASAYMQLDTLQAAWQLLPPANPLDPPQVKQVKAVVERVDAASEILQRLGWPKEKDQAALLKQLKEHIN